MQKKKVLRFLAAGVVGAYLFLQTPAAMTSYAAENSDLAARSGAFAIMLVDTDTGEAIGGTTFALYNSKGEYINSYTTNEEGWLSTYALTYDNYTFVMTAAPEGYIVDGTPIHVTLTKEFSYSPEYFWTISLSLSQDGSLVVVSGQNYAVVGYDIDDDDDDDSDDEDETSASEDSVDIEESDEEEDSESEEETETEEDSESEEETGTEEDSESEEETETEEDSESEEETGSEEDSESEEETGTEEDSESEEETGTEDDDEDSGSGGGANSLVGGVTGSDEDNVQF